MKYSWKEIMELSEEQYWSGMKNEIERKWNGGRKDVYIFGTGLMGRFVLKALLENRKFVQNYNLRGFIDNYTSDKVEGYSVFSFNEIEKDSKIIIASLLHWNELVHQCQEYDCVNYIHYEELACYNRKLPVFNIAFEGIQKSILQNRDHYQYVRTILADEISKRVFLLILNFRLTLNIENTEAAYMLSVANGEKQYFDPAIISPDVNEVFVDIGGYTGDTIIDFVQWNNAQYKTIYFFEPDFKIFETAKKKLNGISNIEFKNCGLGDHNEILNFQSVGDQSGNFSTEGSQKVWVYRLDDVIKEEITFIKMDVEGFELNVLCGAEKAIRRWQPRMAISVYHKKDDIFQLAEYILSLCPTYKVYMRHYTANCADTILYFI